MKTEKQIKNRIKKISDSIRNLNYNEISQAPIYGAHQEALRWVLKDETKGTSKSP